MNLLKRPQPEFFPGILARTDGQVLQKSLDPLPPRQVRRRCHGISAPSDCWNAMSAALRTGPLHRTSTALGHQLVMSYRQSAVPYFEPNLGLRSLPPKFSDIPPPACGQRWQSAQWMVLFRCQTKRVRLEGGQTRSPRNSTAITARKRKPATGGRRGLSRWIITAVRGRAFQLDLCGLVPGVTAVSYGTVPRMAFI